MNKNIFDTLTTTPRPDNLWDGSHKIPWNDPAFSQRILKEHLSQDHNLASRKAEFISRQVEWIHSRCLTGDNMSILDLGCGPGLYAASLAGDAHRYQGIDFSPASIEYATHQFGSNCCSFRLGDVTTTEFGGPYDLTMMLYGELNVFSPDNCKAILRRAWKSLNPGGRLLVEFQNPDAIRGLGQSPNSWTRAEEGGLFSDEPYVSLTENHWFEEQGVTLQCFHVLVSGAAKPVTYRSTTKAWSREEMKRLLDETGFTEVRFHEDWPLPDDSLMLVSGLKK
ncbi:class I SAM-dependent methyltransferase [Pseudodesulfovibrio sp. zrk46]|uniref:class I SAM-dependent methyltransferase n=1 Tax=Pseudodesulfovibrio sp. zrk46 TaxID=2725288 RepID=UPI0014491856|nr:class I SAM-dependent methyltransferase [Pseudodesulfovibrio sp. zrk46]QJB55449.1 class I SAM-dependent methyltransferase [Pseudodesulfovibrio sp. zrk46]